MGLFRSTLTVGGFTMFSRVLGFVRDMVFAYYFKPGPATDAFFVAFKIPNFMRRLFAEGAFSQAFVPVLSEYKALRSPQEVRAFVGDVTGTLGGVLGVVTLLAVVGSPALVMLFAPGFIGSGTKFALTAEMLRITFPYLLFISLTAMAGGILNSYGRFAVPAATPVWLNVCLITAAVASAGRFEPPIMALAWGVLLAGLVQFAFQIPFLGRLGFLVRPRWGWAHEGVRRVLKLMLPAIFGSSVAQINLLVDTIIASFLVSGSVTWLYYSDRLMEFPLGVFGIALGTVILPHLSRNHAEQDPESFARTLDWSLRWVLLIGLPAALGLILLAGPILSTLFFFRHGAFTAEDVQMARLSLMAYGLGLPAFMLVKVLAPGFYARQNTRTPVRIGVVAMLTNMALNLAFVVPMAKAGIPGPHAGLALATSLATFVNAALLFRGLRRDGSYRAAPGWAGFILRVGAANALMALLLWHGADGMQGWLAAGTAQRIVHLATLVGAAIVVYGAALWAMGLRPRQLRGH
jgi:putative peptidoglycan lipid II flippase